jgi:hypothetical protein
MRRGRPALACAAILALGTASTTAPAALAYAWDSTDTGLLAYSPDTLPPTISPGIPDGGTTGGKTSRPPIVPGDGEEMPDDPAHIFVPPEAIDVPAPRARLGDVRYGTDELPAAVAETRLKLIEAARTGDIEALRPLFDAQRTQPLVAGTEYVEDAVDELRDQSGDDAGREILAILLEVLESGYVHITDEGTYVWPYFAEVSLRELGSPQYVELYRLLTSIDVEVLQTMGFYSFYRVGIADDGRIRYFSAGELE